MRASLVTVLLLSGCLDYETLYQGDSAADLSVSSELDLAVDTPADLSVKVDSSQPDMSSSPAYWVTSFAGGAGAKALRGIFGIGMSFCAVGDNGTLICSTNGGVNWAAVNPGTNTDFTGIWAGTGSPGWIVGTGGKIYAYDGTKVTMGMMVPNQAYSAVFGVSAQQVIAVGDDQNQGAKLNPPDKWPMTAHNLNARQRGMWGMTNRLWTFGDNATGAYYDIAQTKWIPQPIPASKPQISFRAGWGTADTDLWVVGTEGNISHLATTPQNVPAVMNVTLNGVWGLNAKDIWAVGDSATILHYDGTSWQKWTKITNIASNESLQAIWGNGTNLWTVTDRGNIYRYQ